MYWYPTILTLHIIFAGGWIINFFTDIHIKSSINKNKDKIGERKLISLYLSLSNLTGIICSTGILITGIVLVLINPVYTFFQMTANHWLTSKQILMLVLLLIIFFYVIPTAKKVRSALGENFESSNMVSEEVHSNVKKVFKLNMIINLIVIINFLFAITHRFFN
ncbi:MAG: hypothetical protein N2249_05925 [Melioribacter sp.]|nr:hypothetical protein [Melioribacter sp.]